VAAAPSRLPGLSPRPQHLRPAGCEGCQALRGLVGLAAGYAAIGLFVQYYPSYPAAPPLWAVVAALVLSLGVGVGFGVWPARRATRLDPVAALTRR
jgi:ABC-type antimicrobial peptide transport system permease subunit